MDTLSAVYAYLRKQLDPSAEPVRIALFVTLAVAAVVHRYAPSVALELDALAAILTTAWARAKVFPGA